MIIKPWMMCTSTPLPVMKPYAKPATSSLSNGNVNGKHSRNSAKTCEDEEIRYLDFTSPYPFVNKNCGYPIGHPRIITKPSSPDISSYFGLVSCTILPPAELYHPVRPYQTGGKLIFPLCSSCVESQLTKSIHNRTRYCHHTDTERALKGTWCTPELEEALMQG